MKRGKEIKLNLPYEYNVISGAVDNRNPESIYIQISAWGKPKSKEEDDFDSIIKQKSKRVKRKLFEMLDTEQFLPKVIVDFNMASSGISYEKRSYMSVEMTLFQKNPIPVNSDKLLPTLNKISEKIITDVFEKDEDLKKKDPTLHAKIMDVCRAHCDSDNTKYDNGNPKPNFCSLGPLEDTPVPERSKSRYDLLTRIIFYVIAVALLAFTFFGVFSIIRRRGVSTSNSA